MHLILAILLTAGLVGMAIFAALPFLIQTKIVQRVVCSHNPVCRILGLNGFCRAEKHRVLLMHLDSKLRASFLLAFSFALATYIAGCQAPTVGPIPNTAPAVASNAKTRKSIKNAQKDISDTRARIKDSQIHAAKGADALTKADAGLSQLLSSDERSIKRAPAPTPTPIASPTPTPSPTPKPRQFIRGTFSR